MSSQLLLWNSIYTLHHNLIVDPVDVVSILQEQITGMIHKLSPVELVFVQRRIRSVIKTLMQPHNIPLSSLNHNRMDSSMSSFFSEEGGGGTTLSTFTTSTTIAATTLGGGGAGVPNVMKLFNTNAESVGTNPTQDASTSRETRSKAVYRKEHKLDEFAFRQVFRAGCRKVVEGQRHAASTTATVALPREGGSGGGIDRTLGITEVDVIDCVWKQSWMEFNSRRIRIALQQEHHSTDESTCHSKTRGDTTTKSMYDDSPSDEEELKCNPTLSMSVSPSSYSSPSHSNNSPQFQRLTPSRALELSVQFFSYQPLLV